MRAVLMLPWIVYFSWTTPVVANQRHPLRPTPPFSPATIQGLPPSQLGVAFGTSTANRELVNLLLIDSEHYFQLLARYQSDFDPPPTSMDRVPAYFQANLDGIRSVSRIYLYYLLQDTSDQGAGLNGYLDAVAQSIIDRDPNLVPPLPEAPVMRDRLFESLRHPEFLLAVSVLALGYNLQDYFSEFAPIQLRFLTEWRASMKLTLAFYSSPRNQFDSSEPTGVPPDFVQSLHYRLNLLNAESQSLLFRILLMNPSDVIRLAGISACESLARYLGINPVPSTAIRPVPSADIR